MRVLIPLLLALIVTTANALDFNIRQIDRKGDVSRDAVVEDMSFYQAESVRFNVYDSRRNRTLTHDTAWAPVWRVWKSSDPSTLYVLKTGTVQNASAGLCRITLSAEEANLPTGVYQSIVHLYQGTTNNGVLARNELTVLYAPGATNTTYVGTFDLFPTFTNMIHVQVTNQSLSFAGTLLTLSPGNTVDLFSLSSGGVTNLASVPDVDAVAMTAGDVLTWSTVASAWTNSQPAFDGAYGSLTGVPNLATNGSLLSTFVNDTPFLTSFTELNTDLDYNNITNHPADSDSQTLTFTNPILNLSSGGSVNLGALAGQVTNISDLADVATIASPTVGHVLTYRAGTGWTNEAAAGGSDNLGDHTATQTIDAGGYGITNLLDPVADQDAATKKYVADNYTAQMDGHRFHSSGLFDGGVLGVSATNGFSITDGFGYIIDTKTDPENVTQQRVDFAGLTNTVVTGLTNQLITFVSIDASTNVIQQASRWSRAQHREQIILGVVVHVNKETVDVVNQEQSPAGQASAGISDILEGLGFINVEGNIFGANGANLLIDKSEGILMMHGINYHNDKNNPHHLTIATDAGATFQYRFQTGSNGVTGTSIDPDIYDVGGAQTAVGNNKYTVQRFFLFTSGNIKVQPGQNLYTSLEDASASIGVDSFVVEPSIQANGALRSFLIVKKGCSDLSDTSQALWLDAGKFGTTLQGGSGSGSPTPDLEAVLTAGNDAGGLAITNALDPVAAQDVATKAYVDANAGATDHGALTGLSDDDHTQYILADGTRAFTGPLSGHLNMGEGSLYEVQGISPPPAGTITLGGWGTNTGNISLSSDAALAILAPGVTMGSGPLSQVGSLVFTNLTTQHTAAATSIEDLDNVVSVATPTAGHVLTYRAAGWTNEASAGGASALNGLTDVNSVTTPTAGHVLTYRAAGWTNEAAAAASDAALIDTGDNSIVTKTAEGNSVNASAQQAAVLSGNNNDVGDSDYAVIIGGNDNDILANSLGSAIVGGSGQDLNNSATYTVILGGNNHDVFATHAAAIGGTAHDLNSAADYSVSLGGQDIQMNGDNAVAGGYQAKGDGTRSFTYGFRALTTDDDAIAFGRYAVGRMDGFTWSTDINEGGFLSHTNDSGTLTSGGTTLVTDSTKSWTVNEYVGGLFWCNSNPVWAEITANTATTLTLSQYGTQKSCGTQFYAIWKSNNIPQVGTAAMIGRTAVNTYHKDDGEDTSNVGLLVGENIMLEDNTSSYMFGTNLSLYYDAATTNLKINVNGEVFTLTKE